MNRREFSQTVISTLASYFLVEAMWGVQAFSRTVEPLVRHWVRELHERSRDVKTGKISPAEWQESIQTLYARVDVDSVTSLLDFEKISYNFACPDRGVHTKPAFLPPLHGVPKNLAFHRKIFGMKKDRAIIPHGHNNMVSCHYVLQGELRLRHYDKVEEDATHMLIQPTVDIMAKAGSFSSISDEKNNIHWLVAATERAFTFDVIVLDIKDKQWNVHNIDPLQGEREAGGILRVRKIGVEEGLRRYGWQVHH